MLDNSRTKRGQNDDIYTENQHDTFYAHLSSRLRLRGIQPKPIISPQRPTFVMPQQSAEGGRPNSVSLELQLSADAEHQPQGGDRQRSDAVGTNALLPTSHCWWSL